MTEGANPFMEALDAAKQLLELVAGYRAECEAKGFSPTAAELMAMEFHKHLSRSQ